ncbi:MAG: hypothetical protein JRI52_06240 [Deltaproteobacteria bacterium]|nr:hypothetical protein [Deltaproteobacteria bacterium]
MSYILEALRKMERQTRKDSQPESWVDDLSMESEEEKTVVRGPNRLLVAVSIFFGASGILTGLLFYEGKQAVEEKRNPIMQSKTVLDSPKSVPPTASGDLKKVPESVPSPQAKGVTLSEIRTKLAMKDKGANKEKLGLIDLEKSKSVPTAVSKLPKHKTVIDLTNSYRLTSTGAMNNRRYATIERHDYYIEDEFMDMVITDIKKDRVHLKGKGNGQPYVIIFRYKKRH